MSRILWVPVTTGPPPTLYGTRGQWDKTLLIGGWFGEVSEVNGWYAAEFLVPSAPGGIALRAWNGASWATGTLNRWNGSEWVAATLRRWSGSGWE